MLDEMDSILDEVVEEEATDVARQVCRLPLKKKLTCKNSERSEF